LNSEDLDFSGKVAIVTGTNREIGAAIAEGLAKAGARVLVAHYGEAERVHSLLARVREQGGKGQIEAYEADLTAVAANEQMIARAVALWGRLDILAANAGLTLNLPVLEMTESAWDTVVNLNLKGSFFAAQAAARQMVAQSSGGRIIFSTSVTGIQALPGFSVYGITKAGLRHMARTMGIELGRFGITVNAIAIGATLNERNEGDDPDYAAHWQAVIPTGRVGQPEDVAAALLFLASPAAAMVNGQTLLIDGGWTATGKVP